MFMVVNGSCLQELALKAVMTFEGRTTPLAVTVGACSGEGQDQRPFKCAHKVVDLQTASRKKFEFPGHELERQDPRTANPKPNGSAKQLSILKPDLPRP